MKILAVIPARGGSKGIPNKNLVLVAEKPLIQYTLEIVKQLQDIVIPFISTDDKHIATYCSQQGFDMTYTRPAELSRDDSAMIDTVLHALDWYELKNQISIDAILLLQPTNPLRYEKEIHQAIQYFQSNKLNSLVSVTRMHEHPYECIEVGERNNWAYLRKPSAHTIQRQQYKSNFYFIDGTFYLAQTNFLKKHRSFVKEIITHFYYLERDWPIDIDNPSDLLVAEVFLQNKLKPLS